MAASGDSGMMCFRSLLNLDSGITHSRASRSNSPQRASDASVLRQPVSERRPVERSPGIIEPPGRGPEGAKLGVVEHALPGSFSPR